MNGKPFKVAISVRLHGNEATIDVYVDDQPLCHSTVAPSVFRGVPFLGRVRAGAADYRSGSWIGCDFSFRPRAASGRQRRTKPQLLDEACPKDQWIDLLPRIDLARDRIGGDFFYAGRGLRLAEGDDQGILMFPAALQGSYELEMEFTHSPSSGMVALVVPVGLRCVTVNVNNKGDIHPDAEWINRPKVQGEDGDEDAAASELEAGVRHKLFPEGGRRRRFGVHRRPRRRQAVDFMVRRPDGSERRPYRPHRIGPHRLGGRGRGDSARCAAPREYREGAARVERGGWSAAVKRASICYTGRHV